MSKYMSKSMIILALLAIVLSACGGATWASVAGATGAWVVGVGPHAASTIANREIIIILFDTNLNISSSSNLWKYLDGFLYFGLLEKWFLLIQEPPFIIENYHVCWCWLDRWWIKLRARIFGPWSSCLIAAWTWTCVASLISPWLLPTRETVFVDIPAALETSLMVTLCLPFILVRWDVIVPVIANIV